MTFARTVAWFSRHRAVPVSISVIEFPSGFPFSQSNLGKKRSELKHLIKERAKKLEEIKQSIKVIKVRRPRAQGAEISSVNLTCVFKTKPQNV